jgi:hypothetical protein
MSEIIITAVDPPASIVDPIVVGAEISQDQKAEIIAEERRIAGIEHDVEDTKEQLWQTVEDLRSRLATLEAIQIMTEQEAIPEQESIPEPPLEAEPVVETVIEVEDVQEKIPQKPSFWKMFRL